MFLEFVGIRMVLSYLHSAIPGGVALPVPSGLHPIRIYPCQDKDCLRPGWKMLEIFEQGMWMIVIIKNYYFPDILYNQTYIVFNLDMVGEETTNASTR